MEFELKSLELDRFRNDVEHAQGDVIEMSRATLSERLSKIDKELEREHKQLGVKIGFGQTEDEKAAAILDELSSYRSNPDALGLSRLPRAHRLAMRRGMTNEQTRALSTGELAALDRTHPSLAGAYRQKLATTTTGMVTGLGLTPTSMMSPALELWPVIYPLRAATPRFNVGGVQVQYKRVTGLGGASGFGFTSEATSTTSGRGNTMTLTEDQSSATFVKLGIDDFFTWEAQYGGKSTIDGANFTPTEVAQIATLQYMYMMEERAMWGANGSTALGIPGAPTAATTQPADTVGSLTPSAHYYFKISALTYGGARADVYNATGRTAAGVNSFGETTGNTTQLDRQCAGSGAGSKAIALTWSRVPGAVAYNVFGSGTTGQWNYIKTVYCTSATITAMGTSTNVPNTADTTRDFSGNGYDGLLPLIFGPDTTSHTTFAPAGYVADILAAGFTVGVGGVPAEIDAAFKALHDSASAGPVGVQKIYMNSSDRAAIDKIAFGSGAYPPMTVYLTDAKQTIKGGFMITSLLNRYLNEQVELITHPYATAGTVVGVNETLGKYFPNARIPSPFAMYTGYDSLRFDYAETGQKLEWGIYTFGAPVMPAPFAFMALCNTGN